MKLKDINKHLKQVCTELPTSADNATCVAVRAISPAAGPTAANPPQRRAAAE